MRNTPRWGAASRTTPPASSVLFFARTKTDRPVESQKETSARSKTRRVRPFSSRALIWSCSWGAVAMSSSPATDTTTMSARCSVCTVRDIQDLQVCAERYSRSPLIGRTGQAVRDLAALVGLRQLLDPSVIQSAGRAYQTWGRPAITGKGTGLG